MKKNHLKNGSFWFMLLVATALCANSAMAAPLPGGTLDPTTITKYVQPLVIPPVMPKAVTQPAVTDAAGNPVPVPAAEYNIAVRQFKQQILPGGVWNTVNGRADAFPPTPIWSYGSASDDPVAVANYTAPAPLAAPGTPTFNYPALTVEATAYTANTVRWINDLKDPLTGNYRPHLLTGTVDQTLHWANPANSGCVNANQVPQTDCNTYNPTPYTGPVPIVTHVHGAHVNANSDGYPEAWWLPGANNIPAGYAKTGTLYTQYNVLTGQAQDAQQRDANGNITGTVQVDFDPVDGAAFYSYENTQPATTLWYHDHSLGITRLNVYAGPAGFWLLRGGANDVPAGTLPGPAPVLGEDPNFDPVVRAKIREIPVVIQDRSFNADGTLFYPNNRAFFDGFNGPYVGATDPVTGQQVSDINPIWNPEAFFNTMVVNGTTWPNLDVAPAKYRLRLLNGSNSRFINLSMFEVIKSKTDKKQIIQGKTKKTYNDKYGAELPFYQIGGDQGFLPQVVKIQTGMITALPGNGTLPAPALLPDPMQALLMAPAERADVIVDFSGLPDGTVIRMINTAPDAPFGGFPDIPADPATSGQVMEFTVNSVAVPVLPTDLTTASPLALTLPAEAANAKAVAQSRPLSLNEEESMQVCVQVSPTGAITTVATFPPHTLNIAAQCAALNAVPQAPKAALLGLIQNDPTQATPALPAGPLVGVPLMWKDPITENPQVGDTENWDFYNLTVDVHPIHMHLVRYQIQHRQLFDPLSPTFAPIGPQVPPLANELGYKDTVLSYPGEITRVKATFDLPGLYVWHCHIVEHEDNEMMRPFFVGAKPANFPVP
ncbi:MAG: copper oxidase [Desulfuromonas sp.]|nr:MAG: copper oxidase [Desulfuromonas sp.]